ncbi:hypothetical protein [Nocardia sp. NPDC059228]|uniref:hypothetical protein n=1 Tax=Nocardia sp. NPDC059228 TaxID=3346777 RepID=UPI0036925DD5
MTMSAATGAGLDRLDARLLALDPDLEDLFAEVEDILCAAAVPRVPRPGPGPSPARRPRSRRSGRRPGPPALWRGRRPAGVMPGIGRGPPHLMRPHRPAAAVTADREARK